MNLRQLEAFRATMRSGSITGAAALLHISQPSVSRLIAELETSLGFALFSRTGHGLVATLEARKFQHSVESMFIGLDKLRDTAEAIRTSHDASVALGVIPIFAHMVMPEAIRDLRVQYPGLHIDVSVTNTPAIVDAVLLQQLDVGVICPMRHYEGIHTVYQTSVPYVCLIPQTHELAKSEAVINIDDLEEEEFVILDQAYLEQLSDDSMLLDKLRKNARIISPSDPAIASIARANGLLSIVDPYTARVALALGGVVVRPIQQQFNYPIAIITRGTDTVSLAAGVLSEALVNQFEYDAL